MCWCTPEIRTPNCGKLDCHAPFAPPVTLQLPMPAPAMFICPPGGLPWRAPDQVPAPAIPGLPEGLEVLRYGIPHQEGEYLLLNEGQITASGSIFWGENQSGVVVRLLPGYVAVLDEVTGLRHAAPASTKVLHLEIVTDTDDRHAKIIEFLRCRNYVVSVKESADAAE